MASLPNDRFVWPRGRGDRHYTPAAATRLARAEGCRERYGCVRTVGGFDGAEGSPIDRVVAGFGGDDASPIDPVVAGFDGDDGSPIERVVAGLRGAAGSPIERVVAGFGGADGSPMERVVAGFGGDDASPIEPVVFGGGGGSTVGVVLCASSTAPMRIQPHECQFRIFLRISKRHASAVRRHSV